MEDSPSNGIYHHGKEGRASTAAPGTAPGITPGATAGAPSTDQVDDLFDDDSDDSPGDVAVMDNMVDSNGRDEMMYAKPDTDGMLSPTKGQSAHLRVNSNTMTDPGTDDDDGNIELLSDADDNAADDNLDGMYDKQISLPTTGLGALHSNHSDLYENPLPAVEATPTAGDTKYGP